MSIKNQAFARVIALFAVGAVSLTGCKLDENSDVNTEPDGAGTGTSQSAENAAAKPSVARLGQPITIKGNEDGAKVQVTVVRVKKKAKSTDDFSTPDAGNRYMAVQFRIRNTGSIAYDDAPSNGAKVVDSEGQQFEADPFVTKTTAGAALPTAIKLAPGGTALGFLVFQVPKAAKIAKVQFSQDSGFAETAEWVVRG